MLKNAVGRRRTLHKVLLILASLAMMLMAAAPASTQESNTAPEVSQKPEVTPYQDDSPTITNEALGDGPAPGSVPSDVSHMGEEGPVYEGAPVSNYQNGEIEGKSDPLSVAGTDGLARDRQPDSGLGESASDATRNQRDVALKAARTAMQAAQEARQASDTAQLATQDLQQSTANPEEAQTAQEAAQKAHRASDAAQAAAQAAQEAAAREDAQAAQEAAEAARQSSGAAESAAQAVQQAIERVTGPGVKDAFSRALQAARSAEAGSDNATFAAEDGPGRVGEDPGKASGGRTAGKVATGEAAGGRGAVGQDTAGDAELGSNAAAISVPAKGGIPMLFLGGASLLAAGIFVALKAFRAWFRPTSVPGVGILRLSGSDFESGPGEKDQGDLDSYRRSEEKERRFTAPGV